MPRRAHLGREHVRAPSAATLNRISRARDVVLDSRGAERAAVLRAHTGVSVVDATVAQTAEASPGPNYTADLLGCRS